MFMINNNQYNVGFASGNAGRIDAGYNSVTTSLSNDPLLEWRWIAANTYPDETLIKDIRDSGFTSKIEVESPSSSDLTPYRYSYDFNTNISLTCHRKNWVKLIITCPSNFYLTYLQTSSNGKGANQNRSGWVTLKLEGQAYKYLFRTQKLTLSKPTKIEELYLEARCNDIIDENNAWINEIRGIFMEEE